MQTTTGFPKKRDTPLLNRLVSHFDKGKFLLKISISLISHKVVKIYDRREIISGSRHLNYLS